VPAYRWFLPCVLTEKRDNFGFLFGIKSLIFGLYFWVYALILSRSNQLSVVTARQ